MTQEKLLRNIRNNNLIEFLLLIVPTILVDVAAVFAVRMIFHFFAEQQILTAIFMAFLSLWIVGVYALYLNSTIINNILKVIHPEKSVLFHKYGTIEEVCKLIDEIEKNVEYEDSRILISSKFFMKKNHYETMLYYGHIDSIKAVHQKYNSKHAKTANIKLAIVDKWGKGINYKINKENSDYVTYLINGKLEDLKNGEI